MEVKKLKCSSHNKSFKYMCNECNLLLCSKCLNKHFREYNHICDHIDDIRLSLENLNLNNNNDINSKSEICSSIGIRYNTDSEDIWKEIKKSSEEIEFLLSKEKEISDSFRSLHEYLVIEEHKIKKPIISDIDNFKENINNKIEKLKQIMNIININNNSFMINNRDKELEIDSSFDVADTTNQYLVESIIKSIRESNSIQQLIDNNKNTIFNTNHNKVDAYKHTYNNDIDLIVLELIYQYNYKYQVKIKSPILNTPINNMIKYRYQNNIEINKIKDTISNIIQKSYSNRLNHKSEIVFSIHSKGITLFDLTNNNIVKEISMDCKFYSPNTTINVNNDYIYIYCEHINSSTSFFTKLCRYNIKNDSFEFDIEIEELKQFQIIQVCNGGKDHLYFYCSGVYMATQILRYNIHTKTCEIFKPNVYLIINNSLFYQNKLYYLYNFQIYVYDPNENTFSLIKVDINCSQLSTGICHDGNGNIYNIYMNDKKSVFIKFNLDSKQIEYLDPIEIVNTFSRFSMVYQKNNDNPNIILFGGKDFGNLSYNIANKKWTKIFENDDKDRNNCDSVLF